MMKAVLALVLLGLVLVNAYTEEEYRTAFMQWMQKYEKSYTQAEFKNRYNIFKFNMDYVRDWNAKGSDTVLGMNRMADLSNEEYQKIYLGTKVEIIPQPTAPKLKATYNATVDWRTKNIITPIKNQGDCGSCWSFSTTGSTEGVHAQSTGQLVSLSEQNLMDCSWSEGNQGCDGGYMPWAFEYILANDGIDTEASYPYTGVSSQTCHYNAANKGAVISSYVNVTSGSETDLATAATLNPVSVAIDASHYSFQLYTSGIYYDIFCSSTKLDHGVLVAGFGTRTDDNRNYWIVKNSWGTSWGMDGWIYMSKDRDNNCGIATAASYPVA